VAFNAVGEALPPELFPNIVRFGIALNLVKGIPVVAIPILATPLDGVVAISPSAVVAVTEVIVPLFIVDKTPVLLSIVRPVPTLTPPKVPLAAVGKV